MTLEERASRLADWWWDAWRLDEQVIHKGAALEVRMLLEERIAVAVREAVAEERAACARLADAEWDGWGRKGDKAEVAADIAAAIRARGES